MKQGRLFPIHRGCRPPQRAAPAPAPSAPPFRRRPATPAPKPGGSSPALINRAAFERDRIRDAKLQAAGLRVLRITWHRLVGAPEAVVATLAPRLTPLSR
ncbi:MAG: endonuclease domain-containing protein [Actinomycetota bacterium]|nr:endonuclease domain-containing protein [Actinomycetota bacterium]